MSILRDLDPQNATIHQSARVASKGNRIAWILTLPLLLGGAIWLFLDNQPSQSATYLAATPTTSTDESRPPPDSARHDPAQLAAPDAGTALIRENAATPGERKSDTASEKSVLQTMQMELEKARGEQASHSKATSVSKAKSTAPDQPEKTTKSANSNKSSKSMAKRSTSTGQRMAKSEKKPAERDIDIISAIVK